jgi:hypothetical protein
MPGGAIYAILNVVVVPVHIVLVGQLKIINMVMIKKFLFLLAEKTTTIYTHN